MALNFPDSPILNQIYTDTTSGFSYQWDGVVWQSYAAASSSQIKILDDISGSFDGLTSLFNLTVSGSPLSPTNAQQLRVVLGGVVQKPTIDYNVASASIVFTSPPSPLLDCSIISLGPAIPIVAPDNGNIFVRQEYNPTGVQTTFTFTSTYTPGYFEVYHNGAKLVDGTDYTATNGSTFNLTTPSQNGDIIEGIAYLQTSLYTLGNYSTDLIVLNNASVGGIMTVSNLTVINNATVGGIVTATSFVGSLTGNATGLSGTPNITVGNVIGAAATFTGNVSIAGTLTYEDVTNVDSVGLITARSGVDVTSGDVNISSGNLSVNTNSAPTNLYVSGNAASNIVGLGATDANTTIDFSQGNNFSLELTGSIILENPTGITTGQSGIILIQQDGSGNRTVGYGSHWDFPSATAPTLSTGANALDVLTYFVRNSTSIVTNSMIGIGTL